MLFVAESYHGAVITQLTDVGKEGGGGCIGGDSESDFCVGSYKEMPSILAGQ
jgi:hypothetical protein